MLSRESQLTNFDKAEADGHFDATVCHIVSGPTDLPLFNKLASHKSWKRSAKTNYLPMPLEPFFLDILHMEAAPISVRFNLAN